MRISVDTNLLVRAAVEDEPAQTRLAIESMQKAMLVAVSVEALCEFVWVLRRSYKRPSAGVALSIRRLVDSPNVVTDRPAVDAGLAVLDAGGDFADGVIAYQGQMLGGETFLSFDRNAVQLIAAQGGRAELLG